MYSGGTILGVLVVSPIALGALVKGNSNVVINGGPPKIVNPSVAHVFEDAATTNSDWMAGARLMIAEDARTPTAGSPATPLLLSPPASPALPTFFVTVTPPPITQTMFDTVTITQTITIAPPPPSPPTPTPLHSWSAPPDFDNLDCFNILKYGFGQSNLEVVQGIPESASAVVDAFTPVPTGAQEWNNQMSAIEAFYPQGSINPGNSPQGGADFYANPLPALAWAQNVTFAYSVFLPVDFEPVRGGKLPGLYGGKTGCSGGDAALDCFSTRLMWRANAEGELYLYAPKDKQTPQVCNTPPRSICEADYGLSIGRGSFRFTPGQWTHVSQTVVLNTPGKQDGYFTLDVDGERIMDLSGLYYRQNPANTRDDDEDDEDVGAESMGAGDPDGTSRSNDRVTWDVGNPDQNNDSQDSEGLLGHILVAPSGTAGQPNLRFDVWNAPGRQPVFIAPNPYFGRIIRRGNIPSDRSHVVTMTRMLRPATVIAVSQVTKTQLATITGSPTEVIEVVKFAVTGKVPGFSGIFFSTFFGGHTPNFATPRDQKIWFKDFSLVVND